MVFILVGQRKGLGLFTAFSPVRWKILEGRRALLYSTDGSGTRRK